MTHRCHHRRRQSARDARLPGQNPPLGRFPCAYPQEVAEKPWRVRRPATSGPYGGRCGRANSPNHEGTARRPESYQTRSPLRVTNIHDIWTTKHWIKRPDRSTPGPALQVWRAPHRAITVSPFKAGLPSSLRVSGTAFRYFYILVVHLVRHLGKFGNCGGCVRHLRRRKERL